MIYNYAKGTDGKFVITGVGDELLYGMNGFTEPQAHEIAFHLNLAHERGREKAEAAMRAAIGLRE